MSADVSSLQLGATPSRTNGSAVKGGSAEGASSDVASFQRMLGRADAGDAPRTGATSEPPAETVNGPTSGAPQCAEMIDELEDLLAMLPTPPWQTYEPSPDPASGSLPGMLSAWIGPPTDMADMVPGEDFGNSRDSGLGLGLGLGFGAGLGSGTGTTSGVLAEARQLLAVLESVHAEAADTAEPFLSTGASGEAVPVRTGAGSDALLARTVHQSVGTAAWADEIAARMNVMAEQGRHTASLRLSPEHLGPLEIRIAVRDDQASVWFGASHPDTRAALEAAMPRLREMFAAQGLSLADTGVFHEAPRQPQSPVPSGREQPLADAAAEDPGRGVALRVQVPKGLLDIYA